MKTARFYDSSDTLRTVPVLDAVPENGSEFHGTDCIIYSVKEIGAHIESDDEGIRNGTAYLVRSEDPAGKRWEHYCIVPKDMTMTKEEFIQNVMDNDEENIEHMSEEQAAEILSWMRRDDYKNEIPADLSAADFAARWNEIKGN